MRQHISSEVRLRYLGEEGSRRVSGLAVPFDTPSTPIDDRFVEVIPSSVNFETSDDGVYLDYEHDKTHILASTLNGSLRVDLTDEGITFEADLVATAAADNILQLVKDGIVTKCSIEYTNTEPDQWVYQPLPLSGVASAGTDYHYSKCIIRGMKLIGITLCYAAQYPGTAVRARTACHAAAEAEYFDRLAAERQSRQRQIDIARARRLTYER